MSPPPPPSKVRGTYWFQRGYRWCWRQRHRFVPTISLEPVDGIPPNLSGYIIGTSLRAALVLVTLTSFSRSQDLGDKFLYPRYLLKQLMGFHQICLDISLGQV